jgi:uncharacterized protein (TIGR04255 family)
MQLPRLAPVDQEQGPESQAAGPRDKPMGKRKQYRNPPLVEVFSEFFFQPGPEKELHSLLVARFWKGKLKTDFPQALEPVGPPTPRHRFASEDGKTLLQIGDNLLVVNQLPPYYGWEKYEPKVIESFGLYTRLWKPASVLRAAVHYVDKVDIPKIEVGVEDYFNLYPVLPDYPRTAATNLAVSYEVSGAAPGDVLITTMKQHPSANPNGMTFLFQWDYVASGGLSLETEALTAWLDGAHSVLSEVFHSTFTDQCRKLWD